MLVEVGWAFALGFGVSKQDGFYLDTSLDAAATAIDFPGGEIELTVDVSIPELANADDLAQGSLGFLLLNVKDDPDDPSYFNGTFAIDLKDPDANTTDADGNRFVFPEVTAGSYAVGEYLTASLSAAAEVNLILEVTFPDVGGVTAVFPSLETDFHLAWNWSFADDGLDGTAPPTVEFGDVYLNAGKFFADFVTPILGKVVSVLEPLRPIIELLNLRMPIFSDLDFFTDAASPLNLDTAPDDGIVTLLELAPNLDRDTKIFISTVGLLLEELLDIPQITGDARVRLGSFDLGGVDVREPGFRLDGLDLSGLHTQIDLNYDASLGALGDGLTKVSDFIQSIKQVGSDPEGDPDDVDILQFPLLKNPLLGFQLLLGQDVELFRLDLPPFALEFAKELSIPIFPALPMVELDLVGSLAIAMDLAFGYDSQGARLFAQSRFTDPSLLLAGLFLADRDDANRDVDEITFTAGIEAFGSLNAVIAEFGVGGGLFASIGLNLRDNDRDGRVRGHELAMNFPNCIFDASGELSAGLSVKARVGFITERFQLAEVTLLDFNWVCSDAVEPVLGEVDANGQLTPVPGRLCRSPQCRQERDRRVVYDPPRRRSGRQRNAHRRL